MKPRREFRRRALGTRLPAALGVLVHPQAAQQSRRWQDMMRLVWERTQRCDVARLLPSGVGEELRSVT